MLPRLPVDERQLLLPRAPLSSRLTARRPGPVMTSLGDMSSGRLVTQQSNLQSPVSTGSRTASHSPSQMHRGTASDGEEEQNVSIANSAFNPDGLRKNRRRRSPDTLIPLNPLRSAARRTSGSQSPALAGRCQSSSPRASPSQSACPTPRASLTARACPRQSPTEQGDFSIDTEFQQIFHDIAKTAAEQEISSLGDAARLHTQLDTGTGNLSQHMPTKEDDAATAWPKENAEQQERMQSGLENKGTPANSKRASVATLAQCTGRLQQRIARLNSMLENEEAPRTQRDS
eukprot:TRINITY_DN31868_c0_g1_i1.p1 TRINITY_DN31868_c0_g1~~TRINITY_DN31868_c0_g1_i1.p1  ORF type:complete len:288 (+),score=20.08 TRINITY_DN31868_c0_g1_i1:111-974(+)